METDPIKQLLLRPADEEGTLLDLQECVDFLSHFSQLLYCHVRLKDSSTQGARFLRKVHNWFFTKWDLFRKAIVHKKKTGYTYDFTLFKSKRSFDLACKLAYWHRTIYGPYAPIYLKEHWGKVKGGRPRIINADDKKLIKRFWNAEKSCAVYMKRKYFHTVRSSPSVVEGKRSKVEVYRNKIKKLIASGKTILPPDTLLHMALRKSGDYADKELLSRPSIKKHFPNPIALRKAIRNS